MYNPVSFFKESIVELKKVYYPTRQETITMTIQVMWALLIFGVFLGVIDIAVGALMKTLLT